MSFESEVFIRIYSTTSSQEIQRRILFYVYIYSLGVEYQRFNWRMGCFSKVFFLLSPSVNTRSESIILSDLLNKRRTFCKEI
jgi:hypothetical protein